MTTARRIGAEDSTTRTALLDAALELMLEEGYAAVTSRRVAARAGLKPQLVHYYFRTMDDLFLALVRRGAALSLDRQARALASAQPLRALWELSIDRFETMLTAELFSLANHRKAIRAELGAYADQFRTLQREGLTAALERYGFDLDQFPADAFLLLMTAVSRVLVMEEALGTTIGHAELRALAEQCLERFEGPRRGRPAERSPAGGDAAPAE